MAAAEVGVGHGAEPLLPGCVPLKNTQHMRKKKKKRRERERERKKEQEGDRGRKKDMRWKGEEGEKKERKRKAMDCTIWSLIFWPSISTVLNF